MGQWPATAKLQFWDGVEKTEGCWNWKRGKTGAGYGTWYNGKAARGVHRISWEMHNGPIPEGMQVLHRCDNRLCVRPDHLFLGTIADNMRDKASKERAARGEHNGQARLVTEQVFEIRRLVEAGLARNEIAARFGVSRTLIYLIATRKKWAHL